MSAVLQLDRRHPRPRRGRDRGARPARRLVRARTPASWSRSWARPAPASRPAHPGRRPRQPDRRHRAASRAPTSPRSATNGPRPDAAYVDRLRLPGLQPDPRAHRRRERRAAARARRRARRRRAQAGPRRAGGGRHRRARRPLPRRDVRRPAAAGRDRPRHRRRAPADPGRRAHRRPRHRDRRGDPAAAARRAATPAPPACWSPTRRGTPRGPTGWSSCATASSSTRPGADPVEALWSTPAPPGDARPASAAGGCRCGWPGATRCATRARSVLVLVMIALPVLAVTAADVLVTRPPTWSERRGRWTGGWARPTRGSRSPGSGRVDPGLRPRPAIPSGSGEDNGDQPPVTLERRAPRCSARRPGHRRCARAGSEVDTERGRRVRRGHRGRPRRDPLAAASSGSRRTLAGGPPTRSWSTHGARRRRASRVGDRARAVRRTGRPRRSSASAESTTYARLPGRRRPARRARPRRRPRAGDWLVDGDRSRGTRCEASTGSARPVLSRAVVDGPAAGLRDPGPRSRSGTPRHGRRSPRDRRADRGDGAARGGAAGRPGVRGRRPPAGATLALMAATGGTPRRRAAWCSPAGVVLGARGRDARRRCSASASAGRCCRSSSASSGTWFGPFDVPWPHLPSSRRLRPAQRVAGRRGPGLASRPGRTWSPCSPVAGATGRPACARRCSGVVLLGVGIAGARRRAYDRQRRRGSLLHRRLARSSSVLGMILLVPVVVVGPGAPGSAAAAAGAAVRRPRRRPAPHPHRARGGRGGRDRGRRGRPRHRGQPATRPRTEATYTPLGRPWRDGHPDGVRPRRRLGGVPGRPCTARRRPWASRRVASDDACQARHLHRLPGQRRPERAGLRRAARLVGRLLRHARRPRDARAGHADPRGGPRAGAPMLAQGGWSCSPPGPWRRDRIRISGSVDPATVRRRARSAASRWMLPAYCPPDPRVGTGPAVAAAGSLDPMDLSGSRPAGLLARRGADLSSRRRLTSREALRG